MTMTKREVEKKKLSRCFILIFFNITNVIIHSNTNHIRPSSIYIYIYIYIYNMFLV